MVLESSISCNSDLVDTQVMSRLIVFKVEHCRVHSPHKNIARIIICSKLVEFHNQLTYNFAVYVRMIRCKNNLKCMHKSITLFSE